MNAEGLIEGMDGMEKEVQQSFDGMFDLSPQLYGTSSTNMSPNVNVVVNSNYEQDPLGQMVNKVKTFSGGSKMIIIMDMEVCSNDRRTNFINGTEVVSNKQFTIKEEMLSTSSTI